MTVDHRVHWGSWVHTLQRWRLEGIAASMLEISGPLALISAQVLYFSEPLLSWALPDDHLRALAEMFEDPDEMKEFTVLLREETGG